jgi:hypothetical protein
MDLLMRIYSNQTILNPDLIYVCVALSKPDSKEKDRFFILRKKELQLICAANYRAWMTKHDWKRPKNYKSLDNRYYIDNMLEFEKNWKLIERSLNRS